MSRLLAAAETITDPSVWSQVVAGFAAAGTIAAALWAILRFVPGVRSLWATHREKRRLALIEAQKAVITEALEPVKAELRETNARIAMRHRANVDRFDELERHLNRIDHGQKEIHHRIDRHMDEEREERRADRADLLGWFQAYGLARREDVQAARDRRAGDDPSHSNTGS